MRFSLPLEKNMVKNVRSLSGEKVAYDIKNNRLILKISGKKLSTPVTVLEIKLGSIPQIEEN